MSTQIANVDILTQNWELLVLKMNRLADIISTEVVTGNSTYANTGNSTFSITSQIYGTIGANTLVVTNNLRGGNVNGSNADLFVGTNAHFNQTGSILKFGNTTVNTAINSTSYSMAGATGTMVITIGSIDPSSNLDISGNTNVTGGLTTTGIANVGGSSFDLNNAFTTIVTSNADVGATTGSPLVIASFPKATYNSGKLYVQIQNTGNTQITEMVVAHDGTTAEAAVYGTVASPAGANAYSNPLGDLTANVNGSSVDILLTQTNPNSSTKVISQLIK